MSVSRLLSSRRVTVSNLIEVGVSVSDLIDAGAPVSDLLVAGVSVSDLLIAGAPVSDLLAASVSVSDLIAAGAPVSDLLAASMSVSDLLVAGVSVSDLIAAGATDPVLIGKDYQGGIIAYFLVSGDPGYDANVKHGIIAAPSDQSTGIQWYNGSYTVTGATAIEIGTGNANTNTIVTKQGSGSYAAQLCDDLDLGGYSDWYLPSKDELNKLYLNKVAVGGFASAVYWSSSELNNYGAWRQAFGDGYQFGLNKNFTVRVRAVRAF
jgi:hypothetical protein